MVWDQRPDQGSEQMDQELVFTQEIFQWSVVFKVYSNNMN